MKLNELINAGLTGDINVIDEDTLDPYYYGPASNITVHVPDLLDYEVDHFYSSINHETFRAYFGEAEYSTHATHTTIVVRKEA